VYDAATLSFRFAADTKGVDNGDLSKVAWSSDGTRLIAGGTYDALFQKDRKDPLVTFNRNGRRVGGLIPVSDNSILNLKACGSSTAVASGDPAFGLADGTGRVQLWKTSVAPDMPDLLRDSFTIPPDAKQLRFSLASGGADPVHFDLA